MTANGEQRSLRGRARFIRWNRPSPTRAASFETLPKKKRRPLAGRVAFSWGPNNIGVLPIRATAMRPIVSLVAPARLGDVSASTPLQLVSEDKLDVLRYLDEFH